MLMWCPGRDLNVLIKSFWLNDLVDIEFLQYPQKYPRFIFAWIFLYIYDHFFYIPNLPLCHPLYAPGIWTLFCSFSNAHWQCFMPSLVSQKKITSTTRRIKAQKGFSRKRQHRARKVSSAQPQVRALKSWSIANSIWYSLCLIMVYPANLILGG